MARADAVMGCPRDDKPLAALAHAIERREEGPNDDPVFANNAIASDAIAFACGRIARPDAEVHSHDDEGEVTSCNELSRELAATLAGFWVGGLVADEGGARDSHWTPFCVPIATEEEVPEVITEACLKEMLGGALYPLLPYAASSLDSVLAARAAEHDEGGGAAQLRLMLDFFQERDMSQPTLLTCTNGLLDDYYCCILPCFVLAITGKGSLVGVVGVVVQM